MKKGKEGQVLTTRRWRWLFLIKGFLTGALSLFIFSLKVEGRRKDERTVFLSFFLSFFLSLFWLSIDAALVYLFYLLVGSFVFYEQKEMKGTTVIKKRGPRTTHLLLT